VDADVLIIGAGISGISAAYHLQKNCPNLRYSILEARESMGGTWDLFRYPGIRSDSDMYTLGFSFSPWENPKAVADGPSILSYIKATAKKFNVEQNILFKHKAIAAEWNSSESLWTVTVEKNGLQSKMRSRFLMVCGGYYNYEDGYTPEYAGKNLYRGVFVHPQKWDPKLDYTGKKIVVIGSGATAVTLVPVLASKAAQVTMLQRSPSYVARIPSSDKHALFLQRYLPAKLAYRLIRFKNILLSQAFFKFCRYFPHSARKYLMNGVRIAMGPHHELKDFVPKYNPWEQRMCFVPDGDLFKAVKSGSAEIVTDTLETFTETGIKLKSGKFLPADIVISATGLKLQFLGGMQLVVDGKPVNLKDHVLYKGVMLSGIPNLGMTFGYVNASWTLKSDLCSHWLTKVFRFMGKKGYISVTPNDKPLAETISMLDFSSGYIRRSEEHMPRQGKTSPWNLKQSYFADVLRFRAGPLADKDLRFR
jgi:monooxygenase